MTKKMLCYFYKLKSSLGFVRDLDFNAFSFLFVFGTRIDVSETFANSFTFHFICIQIIIRYK